MTRGRHGHRRSHGNLIFRRVSHRRLARARRGSSYRARSLPARIPGSRLARPGSSEFRRHSSSVRDPPSR